MHLIPTDRWEPLDKLVYRGTAIKVLKQGDNGKAGTPEAPRPAELSRGPVNGVAERPVHTMSVSLIGGVRGHGQGYC